RDPRLDNSVPCFLELAAVGFLGRLGALARNFCCENLDQLIQEVTQFLLAISRDPERGDDFLEIIFADPPWLGKIRRPRNRLPLLGNTAAPPFSASTGAVVSARCGSWFLARRPPP